MRKLAFLIVAILVVGGGAYAYFSISSGVNKDAKEAIDQALQKLPPGWTATYKSFDVNLATRQAVLKGIEIHGISSVKLDAVIDEIDVAKPDLDFAKSWSEASANPAALAPDKAVPIADDITVKGVTAHVENQDIKIGSVNVAKLTLFPWALLHDGVPSYGTVLAMAKKPAAMQNPEDMLPILRFEAAMGLGVSYDTYGAKDLSGSVVVTDADGKPETVTYSVASLTGTNVGRGKAITGDGENITFDAGGKASGKVAHVGLSGLDVQGMLSKALSTTSFDPAIFDGLTVAKIDYSGVTVTVPQQKQPVTLGSITLSGLTVAHGLPVSGELAVTGIKVTKDEMTEEAAIDAFTKLGLDAATVSFGAGYQWDVDKKTANLREVSFKVDELGTITLSADLAGIEKGETIAETAMLNHAVLRYSDASLTGRALKMGAAQMGAADPDAFLKQVKAIIQVQGMALGNSAGIKAATAAIASFIGDPHSLTVEFAPPQPVAFATMTTLEALPPPQIFDKLGVKVTANQE
jgi:hypothetical protein